MTGEVLGGDIGDELELVLAVAAGAELLERAVEGALLHDLGPLERGVLRVLDVGAGWVVDTSAVGEGSTVRRFPGGLDDPSVVVAGLLGTACVHAHGYEQQQHH